ncbi:Nuclease [Acropora cervicornis]|uniref:Nuclease n=1 Tax=Acropora cervicornis TaxID=6130 RepID=A0AAD9PQY2_ACRCE|nr:Nuclease [Acropora cervicornis]
MPKGNDYFATYFYDKAGIAAYSAYIIQASDAQWIGSHKRTDVSWRTTPGINKQGSDDLYSGSSTNNIDKGHLNPSLINSYDCNHQIATFTYTNAVPQFANHNRVSWKNFEGRIANYVKHECAPKGGNMYLITGTSSYIWDSKKGEKLVGAKIELFPPSDPNGIVRPNSLWTAGCCVVPAKSAESIAVWGNNDNTNPYTVSLSLPDLEKLLGTSTFLPANLFPAIQECRKNSYADLENI